MVELIKFRSLLSLVQVVCAITLNYCTYTNHVGVSPRALYCGNAGPEGTCIDIAKGVVYNS